MARQQRTLPVTLVVDASVAAQWVLPEAQSSRANALRSSDEPIVAPDLVYAEIGNAIWKRALQRDISPAVAVEALATATSLFTVLVPMGELAARAIEIAIALRHPIYDCFYLALAERERAPLISTDKRLIAAAKRTKGIEVRAL
jgi:predicted nucleic acid-binding protein